MGKTPAHSKKKRRLFERELPTKLDVIVPESRLYQQLLKFEQRVDATVTQRQIDIVEAFCMPQRAKNKLRLYISNEHHMQESGDPNAGWTLRVQGQLLDNENLTPLRNPDQVFSNYIRKMIIQLDPKIFPGNDSTIEWRKDMSVALTDGFEIKRRGTEECTAKIQMWLDRSPKQYKLSKPLSRLLGITCDSRPVILNALHNYLQSNNLIHPTELKTVNIPQVFVEELNVPEQETMLISELLSHLRAHLGPPDPLEFIYTIRVTGDPRDQADCYEVTVDVPHSFSATQLQSFSLPCSQVVPIAAYQEKIEETVKEIQRSMRRREFLLCFAEAPCETIQALLHGQSKDMEALAARQAGGHTPDPRLSSYYKEAEWLPDAVDRHLANEDKAKEDLRQAAPAAGKEEDE